MALRPPRAARVAQNPRYYALNSHPSFRAFGPAEYRDAQGREYRVGPVVAGDLQRLDVKLPRANVPWFDEAARDVELELTATDGSGRTKRVRCVDQYRMQRHRTGHVHVWQSDWV